MFEHPPGKEEFLQEIIDGLSTVFSHPERIPEQAGPHERKTLVSEFHVLHLRRAGREEPSVPSATRLGKSVGLSRPPSP
jgi:hypothetical protein